MIRERCMRDSSCYSRVAALTVVLALSSNGVRSAEGDLLGFLPFSTVALQDLDFDVEEQVYWVSTFLDGTIHKYSADLKRELEVFRSPEIGTAFLTGLAFNTHTHTIFVVDILSGRIYEFQRDGRLTGRVLQPPLPGEGASRPIIRGLSFDPSGDNGRGSLYAVETTGTMVLELDLDGQLIRHFLHPNDPDGFPGEGRATPATDIVCIHENGELVGFYLTGGGRRVDRLLRLNRDGQYVGRSISLTEAGGNVSGVLRRKLPHPVTGLLFDSFVCAVDSNARFAVLRGGEPTFHEVVDLECTADDQDVRLTWKTFQEYDGILVERGCEVLAELPGTAQEWQQTMASDGVYELTVTAHAGGQSTQASCTVVVGGGAVLQRGSANSRLAIDLAHDGGGFVYVTDASERALRIFDTQSPRPFEEFTSIPIQEDFYDEGDLITGIAYERRAPQHIYLFNASQFTVGVFDDVGALQRIFDAKLPILEEADEADDGEEAAPYRGFVEALTFDPTGAGTLWLIETDRDRIYEIDLDGNIQRSFEHPYRALNPPPTNVPFGINSGGIAHVDSLPGQLLLGGGTLYDGVERHIFRVDKATGQPVPGSAIPTEDLARVSTRFSFTLESLPGEPPGVVLLTHDGSRSQLIELRSRAQEPAQPTLLEARQTSLRDEVELEFVNNGPYDLLEVLRNCEVVAELPGNAEHFIDLAPPSGYLTYGVRAQRGAAWSDVTESSVQVGVGAVLERTFSWPARSSHQLTRDPVDGSYLVAVLWPGDERSIFRFNRHLVFQESRSTTLVAPWSIDTLAVRAPQGRPREVAMIVSERPVPIDNVAGQAFDLVTESLSGEPLRRVRIFPPRPTNGFVTFPTGLNWDPDADTFYYVERNTRTIVEMAPDGSNLRQFPHPAPPFQNEVMNFGLSLTSERTLLFATSGRDDFRVTSIGEMSLDGVLTGRRIPLENLATTVSGFAQRGDELVAAGGGRLFSELVRIKARDPSRLFLRGDADDNGRLDLTDASFTLNFLFLAGTRPACEDALDADDNAQLDLNDALVVLNYLFLNGETPALPFPDPGVDPTADGIDCF